MPRTVTIKQLHATTGDIVRRAGSSRSPVFITDRGAKVAVLASPSLLKPLRPKRVILAEFAAIMARKPGNDVLEDLDAVRGDR